jgi:hypothetical protein
MIKLSSPLAIAGISIASLLGVYLFFKVGKKVIKHKFGVEPKTLLDTITHPGKFETFKNIQSSSSKSLSKSLSNNSAIFGSNKSSSSGSKGGGSKRRCKKGGKRKTKGRK